MLKRIFLAASVVLSTASLCSAFQVSIRNNSNAFPFGGPTGQAMPQVGASVALGNFTSDMAVTDAVAAGSATDLNSAFTQFGATQSFGANGLDGVFQSDVGAPINAGNPLINTNIYLVAYEGASLATATSVIVYKSPAVFQQDPPASSPEIFFDRDLTNQNNGFSPLTLLAGANGDVTVPNPNGADFVLPGVRAARLIIPEPTGVALLGLGVGLLALRRRR